MVKCFSISSTPKGKENKVLRISGEWSLIPIFAFKFIFLNFLFFLNLYLYLDMDILIHNVKV